MSEQADYKFLDVVIPESDKPILPIILDALLQLKPKEGGHLYFRGESREHKYLTPSLYRNENLSIYGSEHYYRSLISELGRDDYTESTSLVRLMAELRHYEGLTRILDISRNPLTAVFNAVEKYSSPEYYEIIPDKDEKYKISKCNKSKSNARISAEDGFIYIFETSLERKEKFDTGHTIAIKTALNLMPQIAIDNFMFSCQTVAEIYTKIEENQALSEETIASNLRKIELRELVDDQSKLFIELADSSAENITKLNIAVPSIASFMELLNQRARVKERLKFPFKIYNDLCEAQLFIPSMNTDRIKRQRGAFIYPAFIPTDNGRTNSERHDEIKKGVHKSICDFLYSGEGNTILIPSRFKKQLREELYLLGIDEGFLYSDIKHQSEVLQWRS